MQEAQPSFAEKILKELDPVENQCEYLRSKIFAIAAEVQESEAAAVIQIILDRCTLLPLLENKPSLTSLIFDILLSDELVSHEGEGGA